VAYNINADVAAGCIAGELKAANVLFLTDIAGILDKQMELIPSLTVDQVMGLINDETITSGMIPKVTYARRLGIGGWWHHCNSLGPSLNMERGWRYREMVD
jgi:acetylglutamate kinase